jgi:hypothetical protein
MGIGVSVEVVPLSDAKGKLVKGQMSVGFLGKVRKMRRETVDEVQG